MGKTSNWKAFGSKYLKAENVENNTDKYVITNADSQDEDGKETVILSVEREGITKLFGCNATNEQAVRAACKEGPFQAIGKVVTFETVQAKNPVTNQIVDALRINFGTPAAPEQTAEPTQVDTEDAGIADDSTM